MVSPRFRIDCVINPLKLILCSIGVDLFTLGLDLDLSEFSVDYSRDIEKAMYAR